MPDRYEKFITTKITGHGKFYLYEIVSLPCLFASKTSRPRLAYGAAGRKENSRLHRHCIIEICGRSAERQPVSVERSTKSIKPSDGTAGTKPFREEASLPSCVRRGDSAAPAAQE